MGRRCTASDSAPRRRRPPAEPAGCPSAGRGAQTRLPPLPLPASTPSAHQAFHYTLGLMRSCEMRIIGYSYHVSSLIKVVNQQQRRHIRPMISPRSSVWYSVRSAWLLRAENVKLRHMQSCGICQPLAWKEGRLRACSRMLRASAAERTSKHSRSVPPSATTNTMYSWSGPNAATSSFSEPRLQACPCQRPPRRRRADLQGRKQTGHHPLSRKRTCKLAHVRGIQWEQALM